MVQDVLKGGFTYTVSGKSLTVAAKGVTKVRFPKVGSLGDWVVLDLTGFTKTFDFDTNFNSAGCGITESVDWGNAMPWFDYLVNVDNTAANVQLGTSRDPRATQTPASANIHYNNAVSSTENQSNFMLACANTVSGAEKPCICIGSHRMTYASSDKDWTPQSIVSSDGFRRFQEGVVFTFPKGQNGATASKYFSEAGSTTSLDFADTVIKYTINRDGRFWTRYSGGTRGANSDASNIDLYIHLPYAVSSNYGGAPCPVCVTRYGASYAFVAPISNTGQSNYILRISAGGDLDVSNFTDSSDYIGIHEVTGQAF